MLSRSRSEAAGMSLLTVRRLRGRLRVRVSMVVIVATAEDGVKILGAHRTAVVRAAAVFMAARRIRWLGLNPSIASGRLRSLEHKFARTASEDRTVASPTQHVQKKEIS